MTLGAGPVASHAHGPQWGARQWMWSWLGFVGLSVLGLLVPYLWPAWPEHQAFLPPWGMAVFVAVLSVSPARVHWQRTLALFGLTHVVLIALFAHQWVLLAWVPLHMLAAAAGAWVLRRSSRSADQDFYHPIQARWWILLLVPVWWLSFGLPASALSAWLTPEWINDQWPRVFSRAGVIAIFFVPLCLALVHRVRLLHGRGMRAWQTPLLWLVGLTAAIHLTTFFHEINEAFPLIVLFGGLTFAPVLAVLLLPILLMLTGLALALAGVDYPYMSTHDSRELVIRLFSWALAYLVALHLRALQSESQARSRQTRALLMAVVTSSPIGTVVRRFDAPVLRMNAACRAWFHDPALPIDSEEPIDLHVFKAALSRCEIGEIRNGQYVAVTDAAELFDPLSLGIPLVREHIALKAPGWPIVHLRLTSTLLHDADGKPTHAVIYAQDISRLVSDNLLLNGILDALPVGVLLRKSLAAPTPAARGGAHIYVNDAHLDIFGLTREQALGQAALPDALRVARADTGELIFSGQPQRRLTDLQDHERALLRQPTGIEVSWSATQVSQAQMMLVDIHDVFGELSHVVMVSVDTRQLTEQQRLLRQLIRDMPLGLAILALDQPADTVVNRAMLEFLGLDEAQYQSGPSHWDAMEFGTLDAQGQRVPLAFVSPLKHSAETATELSFGTCYVRRAAGDMRYAELRTLFLRDAVGRPTHVVEFALDRTKAVLQELLMAKLVAQSPVGVMVRDAQTFEPRYANQAMAAIVGQPLQALLAGTDYSGVDFGREVDGRLESFAEPPLQQVIHSGTAIDEGATFVRRADGTYRFTRSLHEVVHDASGRLVYVLAFVTDETYLRRQARLLRSLVSAMPLGLNVMELKDGELVPAMTSPTAIQWSGLTLAQNMGQEPIPEGFHAVFDNGDVFASATGQVRVRQFLSRQLKTGLPAGVRHLTVRRADGQTYFADYWFIPIHGPDGSMEYLLSVAVDQTHHKALQQVAERANAELREANQRLSVIVENLPGGVAAFDADGLLLLANQSLGVYLDLPPQMLEIGVGHFDDLVRYRAEQGEYGSVDVEALVRERHALLALKEPFVDERPRANGRVLELRTAPLPGGGMVTTYIDVTERKAAEDQIRQLAFYDVLTRLPNRRLLLDRLERAIEFSTRHSNFGAVLFLDLDQFKSINDTRGHDAGDELLVAVAQRLQASVRDADTVARLGGDEFVVLLSALGGDPRTAAEAAHRVAGKLNQSLAAPYAIQGDLYPCTSSIGVTVFGRDGDTVATILKQADIALYQAKDGGRNTVRFFDQAMQASVQTRVHMEAGLRRALLNSEFYLEYQPQLNTDGSVRGAEVLLRWVGPDGGLIPPAQFIPTAEDTALIIPIGLWVFEEVCWRVAGWQHQPGMARLVVSVNVSARQLREPDFVPAMASILHRTGVAPQRLMLELTESIVIQDLRDVVAKLDALKALGLGLSMDDFGTGYSSLSQLQRLPLDELKIDQSFVRDIETDPGDAAIARAVIAMALALDMEVVAEGVETPGQHAFLAEQGCSAYQGYWFSRPLTASRFEQWVLERAG